MASYNSATLNVLLGTFDGDVADEWDGAAINSKAQVRAALAHADDLAMTNDELDNLAEAIYNGVFAAGVASVE